MIDQNVGIKVEKTKDQKEKQEEVKTKHKIHKKGIIKHIQEEYGDQPLEVTYDA